MANRITFDPSEDPTPEMMAAEQAALEQGEKLVQAQQEDRARKFEQSEAEGEDVSLIDGKFKSQEDLLKAYKELQKKLGANDPQEDEEDEEEDSEAPTEEPEEEEEVSPVEQRVRLFNDISTRLGEDGSISEEDRDTLAAMDSKDLVEAYFQYAAQQRGVAQQTAANQREMKSIRDAVGGDEAYGEMIQWAGQNLSEAEVDQFNAVINTNNPAAIRFAVESLSNRWRGAEGYEAPLVTGRKAPSKGKTFRSQAELARAISDPRYQTDPAYRMDVEEKLARSGDLL